MTRIIRVFPRQTAYTPRDDMAFVGEPPLILPEADEVHVSCTFTWDVPAAERLVKAWAQYYPFTVLGGPAIAPYPGDAFTPGMYVKQGIVFSSRGCNGSCPWCLVPEREGRLRELPIQPGHVIQDNSFLQCSKGHRMAVYEMLSQQRKAAVFAGGLQASLVTDEIADELRQIRIAEVFLAADTWQAMAALNRAVERLSWLGRRKLRCYMLLGYGPDTLADARLRLEAAWKIGVLPFAQLYQPSTGHISYHAEWRKLAKQWSRPAAMFASHGVKL